MNNRLVPLNLFILLYHVRESLAWFEMCNFVPGITIEVPLYKTIIPKDASIMVTRTVES